MHDNASLLQKKCASQLKYLAMPTLFQILPYFLPNYLCHHTKSSLPCHFISDFNTSKGAVCQPKSGLFSGEGGVGGTVELTLQEVFDEVCPSEEEEGEIWPSKGVESWGGIMEVDQFVKLGGKRKGKDASSAPPAKKAFKSSKDQVQVPVRFVPLN